MDEFTDGQEMTENTEQIMDDSQDFESEPETIEPEQTPAPITPSLEDISQEQEEPSDVVEQLPDVEPETEDSDNVSYDDLMNTLTEQMQELKAIHELEEKKQEFYTTYQNMGITLIAGIGLLFGCVCALILSNYLRHG